MKKIIILLFLIISTSIFSQENRHIWKTEVGDFYVKYEGRGSWYDAENSSNSGWRLPTVVEFNQIIGKTSLWFEGWNDLLADGWVANEDNRAYYWTSNDEGQTWSCEKKCAVVILMGYVKDVPEQSTKEKEFPTLGIILVKKVVKNKPSTKKSSKKHR